MAVLFLGRGLELVTVGREQGDGLQFSILQSPDRSCVRKLVPVWSDWLVGSRMERRRLVPEPRRPGWVMHNGPHYPGMGGPLFVALCPSSGWQLAINTCGRPVRLIVAVD